MATPTIQANRGGMSELLEEIMLEFIQEKSKAEERLYLSCFRVTDRGIVAIKEWKPANNLELLKEMQSSGT